MIGYFGYNITEGQKFLNMVMEAVARYEQRQKESNSVPVSTFQNSHSKASVNQ